MRNDASPLRFLMGLIAVAVAAVADGRWSPVVILAGGTWSGWMGVTALGTMGGFPGPDLLAVMAFSLAVAELGLAISAAIFAWVRLASGAARP